MLKCTKINFGWGSAPDPAGGAYSAPPDPLAGFKGPTSKGRGRERTGGQGREGREGRVGEGRGRSTCLSPRFDNLGYGPGGEGKRRGREGKERGGKGKGSRKGT